MAGHAGELELTLPLAAANDLLVLELPALEPGAAEVGAEVRVSK